MSRSVLSDVLRIDPASISWERGKYTRERLLGYQRASKDEPRWKDGFRCVQQDILHRRHACERPFVLVDMYNALYQRQ